MSLTETAIKTSPTEYKGETVDNWRSAKEYFLFSALIKWSLSNHLRLQLFWHVLTNRRKITNYRYFKEDTLASLPQAM